MASRMCQTGAPQTGGAGKSKGILERGRQSPGHAAWAVQPPPNPGRQQGRASFPRCFIYYTHIFLKMVVGSGGYFDKT